VEQRGCEDEGGWGGFGWEKGEAHAFAYHRTRDPKPEHACSVVGVENGKRVRGWEDGDERERSSGRERERERESERERERFLLGTAPGSKRTSQTRMCSLQIECVLYR
jgi:hypothetical protein